MKLRVLPFTFPTIDKEALSGLVALLEAKGITLVVAACAVGVLAGAVVTGMSKAVQAMHALLFGLPIDVRLSGLLALQGPSNIFVPVAGGVLMGITILLVRRYRNRPLVDPVEANALFGGKLSLNDTLIITAQTMISSGFGASVGLEAGYTQMGAGLASRLARAMNLRRNDVRTLVGCGAAGAVAAAFNAPLTGAFYGFELIIGIYSLANVAPVLAAAVSASVTANLLGGSPFPIEIGALEPITAGQYVPFMVLGLLCGAASIAVMYLVTVVESGFTRLAIHPALRPVAGGLLVGLLALVSPQVLSSGHGALHLHLSMHFSIWAIASVFVLKLAASAISIGSGFRGGLFFASLFLGALLGSLFTALMGLVLPQVGIHGSVAEAIGMTSLAVGVVGGPLTMTFLALEATSNLTLTGVVLAAAITSSMLVRSVFGYSFSTWRLHLRGETIRSAHDVSWMRNLTVRSMMRSDIRTIGVDEPITSFRAAYPLGSAQRIVAVEPDETYAGMIFVPDAYSEEAESQAQAGETMRSLVRFEDAVLIPPMNAKAAADIFDSAKAEELAVVDSFRTRKVVGLLTEGHLMRRYAEELDKARRDLSGET